MIPLTFLGELGGLLPLAQAVASVEVAPANLARDLTRMAPLLIPIVALFIPIIVVPTAIVMKQAHRRRELEHAERIRALELGRTLPGDESVLSPEKLSAGIGIIVPIGSLLVGWMVCESQGYREEVWVLASVVALAGVIGGTILAAKHMGIRERERARAAGYHLPSQHGKVESYDPDTIDVVGRRG
jgi:hypothetical protein